MELETNRNFKQTRKEAGKISRSKSRRLSSMELEMETNNSCLFLLLPVEIVADIFSRLPIDSVLQCKLVCKTWRDLLVADHHHDNPIVEKAAGGFLLRIPYGVCEPGFHYGEYYYNGDDKVPCFNLTRKTIIHHEYPFQDSRNWYIVGSCNGLICLSQRWQVHCISFSCEPGTHHYDDMYVCNPYTGEYAKLPNPSYPNIDHHPHSINKAYGFGYHPITNEYKVIRIYYITSRFVPSTSVYVQVYTLGSDTAAWRSITATAWGSIGKFEHKQLYRSTSTTWGGTSNNSWGILLNGLLYWLAETRKMIISFDMADEEFRDISTTPEFHGPGVLGVLNGCLCFSTGLIIWVMNNNDYSWSQKFSISWECQRGFKEYYPLARLESGKILLHYFGIFVSYDPETKHIVEVKKIDSPFDIIPYMKSSVSLKALGEKEAIHVKAPKMKKKKHIYH